LFRENWHEIVPGSRGPLLEKYRPEFCEKAATMSFQPSHQLNSLTITSLMSPSSLAFSHSASDLGAAVPDLGAPPESRVTETGNASAKAENVCLVISGLWKGPVPTHEVIDVRMRRLATEVANQPDNWEKIREGMAQTQLSPAYLSVRFKQSTGLPMRSFALWKKFERACVLAVSGHRPADAASMAGFTDQSHLGRASRRFTKMSFGKAMDVLRHQLENDQSQLSH
jgi:AraC-like DNA-binding protein